MSVTRCRPGCGACCIAPSIARPFRGMPEGKPAGTPCVHLDEHYGCRLYGDPRRPECCAGLQASEEMCGESREQALAYLEWLESRTGPRSAA